MRYQLLFLQLVCLIGAALVLPEAQAQSQSGECKDGGEFGCFEVGIPGQGDAKPGSSIEKFIDKDTPLITFVGTIINIITGIIVAIGVIVILVAGYVYMTAGGSGERVSLAKTMIGSALFGIILALVAWTILNTISPQFTNPVEPTIGS